MRILRAAFDVAEAPTAILDPAGTVLEINHGAADRCGAGAAALVGHPLWQLAWFESGHGLREQIASALVDVSTGTAARRLQVHRRLLDGTLAPAVLVLRAITADDGRIECVIASETPPLPPPASASSITWQLPADALPLDDGWLGALHPSDVERVRAEWTAATTAALPFGSEFRIRCPEGHYRWVTSRAVPVRDEHDGRLSWVGIHTDIDARMRAEAERSALLAVAERARTTAELAEHRLHRLTDHSPVGIFRLDPTGACTYVNERWSLLTGISPPDADGQGWLTAVHPLDRLRVLDAWHDTLHRSREFHVEFRLTRDEGTVWVLGQVQPDEDGGGALRGFIGTFSEVSELVRGHENDARLAAIVNASSDAIIQSDLDGRISAWNPAAAALFGYTADEVIGRDGRILAPPHLADEPAALVAQACSGQIVRGHHTVRQHKSGALLDVGINLFPITAPDGTPTSIAGTIYDVSARKRAEEERARQQAELDRMKDDLMQMVVHDLKSPINGMLITAQLALRKTDLPTDRLREYFARIERACRDVLQLIHNILDFGRLEANRMPVHPENVTCDALLQDILDEHQPLAELMRKQIAITVRPDTPPLYADRLLLRRVLVNLLVNALRHSGTQAVRLEAAPHTTDGFVTVRVVDFGRGIAPEDQARIFEKFASLRRDSASAASIDTGLGLPFCRLAVQQMGGEIVLESVPGRGSCFEVRMPSAERA